MAAGEIRGGVIASVLPPREGFSPDAVGAVGLVVHRLGRAGDVVVGQGRAAAPFADRRFLAVPRVIWPPFGRVAQYQAGVLAALARLRPGRIEVHNRAGLAAQVARADPRARVALFIHNDPQAMRGARRPAERAALLERMEVVCVSGYLRDRFMQGVAAGVPPASVLRNAIDLAALPEPVACSLRDPVFLFVGRIVADKGADAFVRAFAMIRDRLPGWRATMIGADRFFREAPETPFTRGLMPRARLAGIELAGYLPHRQVMRAMSRAAVVVVPSRWAEPFGLTALEAMASGAATICGRRGALPEVAGDAALYADPDAGDELEAAMLRLAQDAALRASLSEAGLMRARGFDLGRARAEMEVRRHRAVAAMVCA